MFSKISASLKFSKVSERKSNKWRRLVTVLVAPVVAVGAYMVSPAQTASAAVDVYVTPGYHKVNGREWRTECSKYSSNVVRCFTEIVSMGKWVHNNLTYLPAPRSYWGKNPLANNVSWVSSGRQWRTECDTAVTGRNGCRSYIKEGNKWVFNNMVRFSTSNIPPVSNVPAPTAPSTPSQPSGGYPGANNTGVPSGTILTPYTGPSVIKEANTVIKNKIVNMNLRIEAPNVQIVNTVINGTVDLRDPKTTNRSFSIVDSEIRIGDNLNTGLMRGNFHADRVEITGGRRGAYCQYNCTIENSWVHSQGGDPGGQAHFSGIRMEQNGIFRHNTITCEAYRAPGTGCSAGLTGYGDFAPVQNNLIENNIFLGGGGGGSSVCAYGGSSGDNGSKPYGHLASNIRFLNNVFVRGDNGKCGIHGPIKSFDPNRPGNVWSGNKWDDGTIVNYNGR